ncbi:Aste57867_1965 [Aphanomyces stellatus]|uniref:Aste57867_1965 protein n=1 Tax=Aphanomyces stellatus TaxID=120398 RepID=A0A485KBL8_9STRA|nr:hypothetical protein As57867_001963 [Aphanomyces stellatus]VFT79170.1 Aste57867_1965 [Aphanomyces stellatus]
MLHLRPRWRVFSTARRKSLLDSPAERQAKLVCGKCENDLAATTDLFFLHWHKGVHVVSFQNAALEHLKSTEHPFASTQPWKQAKLSCTVCDTGVATRATVRGQEATLFSAKHVSFRLPLGTSPIVSISGLPSDVLRFSSWADLLAQIGNTPTLKQTLKIRQDKGAGFALSPTDHKAINTKVLLAQSAVDVLQLVDSEKDLNHVNILTAFQRFAMFYQRTLQDIARLKRQRLPHLVEVDDEDAARLALYKAQLQKLHHDLNLIYSTRSVLEFGLGNGTPVPNANASRAIALSFSLTQSARVASPRAVEIDGVCHHSDLSQQKNHPRRRRNLALQVQHRLPQERFSVDKLVHFLHGFAILCASDEHAKSWIGPTFDNICEYILTQDTSPELLAMAGWACIVAKAPHAQLYETLLQTANSMPTRSVTVSTQVYQVYLDATILQLPCRDVLTPHLRDSCKQALVQQQHRNVSSTLHTIVSDTLRDMRVPHVNEFVMELGYSLDIALVDERIGIEVNGPVHYQLRYDPSERMLLGASMLKMRHVQHAGWTIIQVPYEDMSKLASGKPRQDYLSFLLEVAMANRVVV